MQDIIYRVKNVFVDFNYVYDILDIAIISVLIFMLLLILKKQNAVGSIKYAIPTLLFFALICVFSNYLPASYRIIGQFGSLFIAIVFILFPHEFRRILWKASAARNPALQGKLEYTDEELRLCINEIIRAVQNMSKRNIGALIVITENEMPSQIIESGTKLNAALSCALIESIFITKGPLHDGAVIIKGNRVIAAGCFLPLSQNLNVPKELGTRHRAAIGVSESVSVTAITVSEETGVISVARNGALSRYYDTNMLTEVLEQTFGLQAAVASKKRRK